MRVVMGLGMWVRRGLLLAGLVGLPAVLTAQVTRGDARATARRARVARFLSGRTDRDAARNLAAARRQHQELLLQPRLAGLSAAWTAVGPAQVASQSYGKVTGRVTSIAIDPADPTGNTVYVGTTGGGVWKSTNAAGLAAAVMFAPLTDTLPVYSANAGAVVFPSLSIGALASAGGVLLAGTGDPNDASDSYYGAGILRSPDGGATWTLAQGTTSLAGLSRSFIGLAVSGLAFSSANPSLVVAGLQRAGEGTLVNAGSASSLAGLYYSTDAGVTWLTATVSDGTRLVQDPQVNTETGGGSAATAVVWNAARQRFYAAIQFHGYYESADGANWTRLAHQPGVGLTATACPANPGISGSASCPLLRGALAVQPASGDMFALTVDSADRDQGLYQDVCQMVSGVCGNGTVLFGTQLASSALEVGSGSTVVAQGDYNLALTAAKVGTDTVLYAGTIDLYRCSLSAGCVLRNTTNAENGCLNPAQVAPAQHAIAALGSLVYLGNDGGVYRSTDGVAETGAACSASDAGHFQNLNGGLGSLAEVVSFAQDPADAGTLLAGLGALGTAGTGSATPAWAQLSAGEGGTVAIDPSNPSNWYVSTGAGVSLARCAKGAACGAADFTSPVIGATQTGNDIAAVHAPWLLDPQAAAEVVAGTCRVWRGPGQGGTLWSSANALSRPFGDATMTACSASFPVVRSLAAGGPVSASSNAQNAGSEVLYAGLAGALDGGQGFGGHVFANYAAHMATNLSAWVDLANNPVTNDAVNTGIFNPGGFDISSLAVDPHDATGLTVYVTVMGFSNKGVTTPHVYRSLDGGAHWTNVSANLPRAPANSVLVDPNDANTVYVATDTGVYVTTQIATCPGADCWGVLGTLLPNAPAVALQAAAAIPTGDGRIGELRVATYGRGIWQIPLLTAASAAAPAITVSPTALSFAARAVGTVSDAQAVTVTNSGSAALTVSSVSASGDYATSDTCVGSSVAVGASCTVQIRFAPTATGTRSGLLTVYGNVAGGQATVPLSGTATTAPAILLTPGSLVFAATSVGATSAVQNVVITNTGGTTAAVQSLVVSGDFVLAANSCGKSLAAKTGCTLSVAFAPVAAGTRNGFITVVDDAGTQAAPLTGTATSPATDALSPLTLAFPGQQLNTVSAIQPVTLTNAGDVTLTLIAASITSGDFTVGNTCGPSLVAHASCTLNVAFVPKSVGVGSGVLTVSDQFRSQTVALSGLGLAPPGVSLSPVNGLAFGAVGVGLTGSTQTVTLTNNGGVALAFYGAAVSGDFTLVAGSSTCGISVAPGAVCTVGIQFAPTVAGTRTGTVTFTDSAASSPQAVALAGIGIDFTLTANGATSQTIASGKSATYGLLLSAAAGLPGSAVFTCAGVPLHAACTVSPGSQALGGTQSIVVTVSTGLSTARLDRPWMPFAVRGGIAWGMLVPVLLWRKRRRMAALAALILLAGCSAGRTLPGDGSGTSVAPVVTPSGTYTILVTGSSAGLVRPVTLTLVVQ